VVEGRNEEIVEGGGLINDTLKQLKRREVN
jgi:hypothetical protein